MAASPELTRRAVLAGGTLLFTAGGCVATGGVADPDRAPLRMLTHYGNDPQRSALRTYIDRWNARHPRMRVEAQAVSFDDLLQTITVRHTAGIVPDIIQGYSLWAGQLVDGGVLAPAPPDVAADVRRNYSPAAAALATVDDRVVGFPSEVQAYALFYNERILAEAGFDHPPRTWGELERIARRTTERDDAGNILVTGFGLEGGWDSGVVHPFLALTHAAGGSYLGRDGARAAFDSRAGIEALRLQARLIASDVTDPGTSVLAGFGSGKSAMVINAGWWIGSLKASMGEAYRDVGVTAVPGPRPGQRGSVSYGYFTGVNSRSDHKREAWEFLRWLNAERQPSGVTRMGELQFSLGALPGRLSDGRILVADADDPNYQPFLKALQYAMPEPNPRHGQRMKTLLQNEIESVWTGGASAADALRRAAAATDAALADERG